MNIKPAPFALTPHLIERVLDSVPRPSAISVPPVVADGPIEPARVAPVQAAPSAPAEFPPALGRPDTSDARGFAAPSIRAIGEEGKRFRFKSEADGAERLHRAMMARGSLALRVAIERAREVHHDA